MTEEWTVVTATDKKRVMRKRGVRRKLPPHQQQVEGSVLTDGALLLHCLQDCIDYLLRSALWKHATTNDNMLDTLNQCSQIVCYGIGNFSKSSRTYYSASLWQLAFAVCLSKHLDDARLVYYDPCSTAYESAFLESQLQCTVLPVNDQGNHAFCQSNNSALFFMPHCPATLYENVVWSNWEQAAEIWIVGNSLKRLSEKRSGSNGVDLTCVRALLPWLDERALETWAADCDEAPGNFAGAFNDTYISRYKLPDGEWPKRPYDALQVHDGDQELI